MCKNMKHFWFRKGKQSLIVGAANQILRTPLEQTIGINESG
jgi:hypothetical protein